MKGKKINLLNIIMKGGLSEFIRHLDEGRRPVFEKPIEISGERENIPVN